MKNFKVLKTFIHKQVIILLFLSLITFFGMSIGKNIFTQESHAPHTSSGNPAEMYCTEIMGYDYYVKTAPDGGQSGVCVLPDNQECNQWDFYAGVCGAEYSYCVQHGYDLETKTTGRDPFYSEYSVCVNKNDGTEIPTSQLSSLSNLMIEYQANQAFEVLETEIPLDEDNQEDLLAQSFPATWDWRNYNGQNWMTPAKDQNVNSCDSCWAFAPVGAVEAHHNIISGNPNLNLNLAEQELVSCARPGSCSGGGPFNEAFDYIKDNGIVDESCMPYTASDSSCLKCSNWQTRLTSIDAYHIFYATTQSSIKEKLIEYGPVVVNMGTVGVGQYFDSNGIFRCADDTKVNHSVVIVGYNDYGSYWIVKNSRGTGYQDNGYFKVGYNECNIDRAHVGYIEGFDHKPPTKASSVRPNGWTEPYTNDTTPSFAWNPATDSDSGMAGYYVAVDDWTPEGGATNDWWAGNVTSYTVPNMLSEGKHIFAVTSKDNAGNVNPTDTNIQGDAPYYTFYVDTIAPSGSFTINNGENISNTTQVIINSTATDTTSGVAYMRIRNSGEAWGDWQSYNTKITHLLPAVTGQTYTVEIQYRDKAGNISSTIARSITLDIYPERPSSTSYSLMRSTLGNSMWKHQSASYGLYGTAGQPSPAGSITGINYHVTSGYWSGQIYLVMPKPDNDEFDLAKDVSELQYIDRIPTYRATSAYYDPPIPDCNLSSGAATVWYKYTPNTNSAISIDTRTANYDTFIAVWTGTKDDLEPVVCNDDIDFSNGIWQSQVAFRVQANTAYYIEIGKWDGYYNASATSTTKK